MQRVDAGTKINFSAVVRDRKGAPFFVNSKRGSQVDMAPIVNGRADIHCNNPVVDTSTTPLFFDNEWWKEGIYQAA